MLLLGIAAAITALQTPHAATTTVIRVNQFGYLPNGPKTAVACVVVDSAGRAVSTPTGLTFQLTDTTGRVVQRARSARRAGPFGPCIETFRLDFSSVRTPGRYQIAAGDARSPVIRIDPRAYAGAADTLLYYMRQQRSGY